MEESKGEARSWPPATPHRIAAMDTRDRVAALWQLYEQLDALITPEEIEMYPALEHLGDLINDLEMEIEE
ncbi:MAG: hypothetical protein RLZZ32_1773 [Cyanobacteriota bacterium]|jgi:hypothetical protein